MTMQNRWQSFEGSEPVLTWVLAVPLPSAAERRACVDEVLAAGAASGVLVAGARAVSTVAGEERLPSAGAAHACGALPFASRVVVRDGHGTFVDKTAGDAGALLSSLEALKPAYARRFAAPHPFAAAWTTSTPQALSNTVAFFTSLWLPHGDDALLARNLASLEQFRAALGAIARRCAGRLQAPLVPGAR